MWRVLRPDAPGAGQEAGLLEKVDAVDSLALHGYAEIGELAGRGSPADIDGVDADGVDFDICSHTPQLAANGMKIYPATGHMEFYGGAETGMPLCIPD